jgi:hypothetical protein
MRKPKKIPGILQRGQHIIERRIYLVRGQKVMLDSDQAELYEVEMFNLNKAIKRNFGRFPMDFMFQLTKEEARNLGIGRTGCHFASGSSPGCTLCRF